MPDNLTESEKIQRRIAEIPSFVFEQQKNIMDTVKFTLNLWLTANSAFAFAILNGNINTHKMIGYVFMLGATSSLFAGLWTFLRQMSIQRTIFLYIKGDCSFTHFIKSSIADSNNTYSVCSYSMLMSWISFTVGAISLLYSYV